MLFRSNIETKIDPTRPNETLSPEDFVAVVLDLLQKEHFEDRVMLQSFDWRTLQIMQKRAPKIPTVYLSQQAGEGGTVFLDKTSPWTAGFNPNLYGGSVPRAVRAAGGSIWSPLFVDVNAAAIAEAHGLGLQVVVWTVNKPEDMARLIDMGVDGIISDRPDLLRQVMGEKRIALPKPYPVAP